MVYENCSKLLIVFIVLALSIGFGTVTVQAEVDPSEVFVSLAPGDSTTIEKNVTVPEVPDRLDLLLMIDLSGSYNDDLLNITALAPGIFDDVRAGIPDSQFGLTSFIDFPYNPWGSYNGDPSGWLGPDDYPYMLDLDFTTDKTTWTGAIGALTTGSGFDEPESQYYALQQAAGAGMDPAPTWRDDATSVLAITTDASFHTPGDSACTDPNPPCDGSLLYPDPTELDTLGALTAANIKVIAIKAPGATTQMDDLAAATGGSVQVTSSTSEEIADAILGAFEELTFNVTADASACDPGILDISYDPTSYVDVLGGETVVFQETVAVNAGLTPADVPEDGIVCCNIDFLADDDVIGTQELCVQVAFVPVDIKPTSCPNPLNVNEKGRGVLPVAIVSTETFDATQVDPESVRLEGVAPLRWDIEYVTRPVGPFAGEGCMDCTRRGPDRYPDLTLKFSKRAIIAAVGDVINRECKTLRLTGELFSGELIVGEDNVIILKND